MDYLYKKEYDTSETREYFEMAIYSLIAFLFPFSLGHPQMLVGILVNAALVMAALNLRGWKLLPVILLPSIGVLARGLVFGPLTIYLVYMIPFIWLGNLVIVLAIKKFFLSEKIGRWSTLGLGSVLKTLAIFIPALILVTYGIIPKPFLIAMGPLQLLTAVVGGFSAFAGNRFLKRV